MPVKLGSHRAAAESGPLALLRGCHARIRSFASLSVRLFAEEAAPLERAEAGRAVHRYFTVALPLHSDDEERSLAPLLQARIAATLERMTREHRELEALVATLSPAWLAAGGGGEGDRLRPLRDAERFAAAFEGHLGLEEAELFPAVEALGREPLDRVWLEMQLRRRPAEEAHIPVPPGPWQR